MTMRGQGGNSNRKMRDSSMCELLREGGNTPYDCR